MSDADPHGRDAPSADVVTEAQNAIDEMSVDEKRYAAEVDPAVTLSQRKANGQFRKGVSGNRGGRPPKQKEHLHEVVRRVLDEPVPVALGGQQSSMSTLEALLRSAVVHAFKDPRQNLALIKTVLPIIGQPAVAEGRVDPEMDAFVLAGFRRRQLSRFGICPTSGDDDAHEAGAEVADGDVDDDQGRSS